MNLKLNVKFNRDNDDDKKKESLDRIKKATNQQLAGKETIDEAWARILKMNNTELEANRLLDVKKAMENGLIGREASKNGKQFSKSEALNNIWVRLNQSQRSSKLANMVANMPANYTMIDTLEKFQNLLVDLEKEPVLAFDTETDGVDVYTNDIVGVSFTLPNADYHVYIPIAHDDKTPLNLYCDSMTGYSRKYILNKLKPVLENEHIGKVLHNAKFDIHMLLRYGIRMRGLLHDTMVAHHLLNENEKNFKLKDLVTKYLKEPSDTFDDLFGKNCKFNTVPLDVALVYAAKDTHVTYNLYLFHLKQFEKLPNIKKVYDKVENPLIDVLVDMEQAGFIIDVNLAKQLEKQMKAENVILERELNATFGEINLQAHQQTKPAIEKAIGQKIESTDKKVLKKLSKSFPIIEKFLKYKENTKLLGTYIEALPKQIKPDGRVHGSFNQIGTVTGRFSSNNPNLQNQPKYARKLFVAPKDMILMTADFSAQEPRLLAHFTQEEFLLDVYKQGKDLYSMLASEVFNLPIEQCGDGSKYRKMMKMGVLAVMYGTSPKTLAEQLGITQKEAEEFIEKFYAKYKKVKNWIEGNKTFAKKHGYVQMLGGRKRRLPGIKSSDIWEVRRNERQCTNAIIQGSAAIQTKLTMINIHQFCIEKGWQLCLTVHDELGVYAPATLTLDEVKAFEKVMTSAVKLRVDCKTDIEIQTTWGEGMTVNQFFTGIVHSDDFTKEEDYLKQKLLVEKSWQAKLI